MAATAGTIATAYVQILPSTKGIASNLKNEMTGTGKEAGEAGGKSLGATFKSVIAKIGIGAAVLKTLKDTFSEGAKLQQSYLGGLDTIYKESADSVRGFADAASSYGISANDYAEQAVSFGAALRQAFGGDTQKAAESANMAIMDMADNAAKMGTDVGSLQYAYQGFAKQNYTMLDNLKLGYGGTKSEMERLLADAQKLTGVKYDINNLGDVYEAIHVIQGELGITGVAADEAKTTVSGSFEAMKASAKDLIGHLALGDNIQPQLEAFGSSVNTFLFGNLLPMIGNGIKSLVASLPGLMSSAASSISSFAQSLTGSNAAAALNRAGAWITGTLVPFLTQALLPALGQLGLAILRLIGQFFALLWQTLVAKLPWLQTFVDTIKTIITTAIDVIKTIISGAITVIMGIVYGIQAIIGFIQGVFSTIANVISTIWNGIVSFISGVVNGIKNVIVTGFTTIGSVLTSINNGIKNVITTVWNGIKSVVTSVLNGIKSVFTTVWNGIKSFVTTVINEIKSVVTGTLNALKGAVMAPLNGIKNAFTSVFNGIKSFMSGIVNWLKGIFNFHWSLPKIKLPHFKIEGSFSLNPPSVPHFGVDWYAKGGILTAPTIFGMNGGKLLGGGEAGPEAVLPLSTLKSYISDSLDEHDSGNTYNIYIDGIKYNTDEYIDKSIDDFVVEILRKGQMYGGN